MPRGARRRAAAQRAHTSSASWSSLVSLLIDLGGQTLDRVRGTQASLGPGVGLGRQRMHAEVVAEEQRIALVGAARDANVDVGPPLFWIEEPLLPVLVRACGSGRTVIPHAGNLAETGLGEWTRVGQRRHRDLRVDHRLRGEAGNGGRADVVDPGGAIAQGGPNPAGGAR